MRGSMESPVEPHFGDPGLPLPGILADIDAPPAPDWAFLDAGAPPVPAAEAPEPLPPLRAVGVEIDTAVQAQHAGNRAMAAQLAALAAVLATARANPSAYLLPGGLAEPDAAELATRAAALDAALQLDLTPNQVRTRGHEATVLQQQLPQLWQRFRLGLTSYTHARAAVQHATGLTDPAALHRYDTALAGKAAGLAPGAFRQHARRLQERLLAEPPAARHRRAAAERRVWAEPAEDGMAWLHAYLPAPDVVRIQARLNATARTIQKTEKQAEKQAARRHTDTGAGAGRDRAARRSRPQIRADLAAAWLAGDGTPTAAKVRPLLLVPILSLLGQSTEPALLHGYGPIDPASAARLFADAPAFRRVGTDPISGEILNLDRTRYRPTRAQRDWLGAKYGPCAMPGCDCDAATPDIDHVKEWARDHGPTNIDNLLPLGPAAHRLKTLSKIRIRTGRDADGDEVVILDTPTGHTATRKAWLAAWRDDHPPPAAWARDDPPF